MAASEAAAVESAAGLAGPLGRPAGPEPAGFAGA